MTFTIRVSGGTHSVDIDGDTPILWVVRDEFGLTGTKYGCGIAQCGACTVFLDGKPLRSCSLGSCFSKHRSLELMTVEWREWPAPSRSTAEVRSRLWVREPDCAFQEV